MISFAMCEVFVKSLLVRRIMFGQSPGHPEPSFSHMPTHHHRILGKGSYSAGLVGPKTLYSSQLPMSCCLSTDTGLQMLCSQMGTQYVQIYLPEKRELPEMSTCLLLC